VYLVQELEGDLAWRVEGSVPSVGPGRQGLGLIGRKGKGKGKIDRKGKGKAR